MYYVYVLAMDGTPLMPTKNFGKVRHLLNSKRAKVVSKKPFTIQLNYETTKYVQRVTIGCDPGRTNIGISATRSDGVCLYLSHLTTRNKEIPKLMLDRKHHRQASRRGQRLARKRLAKRFHTTMKEILERVLPDCDAPVKVKDIINTESRFNNRKRPKGWLTPTATQLLRTHINLFKKAMKILPITDIEVELNKFAFVALENPDTKGSEFCHGALFGKESLHDAIREEQDNKCILCGSEIKHFHHIVPKSEVGSDTISNLVGLCEECHRLVHTDSSASEELKAAKSGLYKKFGGTSILNQIIPYLLKELEEMFPGHVSITNGKDTKAFREAHGLEKDHDIDAYCISVSHMKDPKISLPNSYELKQFRRHNRAIINSQRERTYKLDEKVVSKNRHKRMDQKENSLEEWFKEMADAYGYAVASAMRSRLTVTKSVRRYNRIRRIMPGALFSYEGNQYVLTGNICNGMYYRAYGEDTKNFSAKKVEGMYQNTGLVYVK